MGSAQMLLAENSQFLFDLSWQSIFDALILMVNIFVLFILLSYLLIKPAKKLMQDRQERITKQREETEKNKADAEELKAQYEAKIKDINNEAEAILSETRKKAKKNEEMILAEAREEANKMILRANAEIELEKKKAADQMKTEMIEVATAMANKVVAVSIDAKTKDALIEETLREIGDSTWQS